MNSQNLKKITEDLIDIFFVAGKKSLDLRNKGLIKKIKPDNTPVSNGDIEVNTILTKAVEKITPGLPIVSEENSSNKFDKELTNFWLIDPIDGTYDYINNGEEFTLNAALILNKKTTAGIVYAPAKDRMFYTYGYNSSYEIENKKENKINCKRKSELNQIRAVSYSKNLKPEIEKMYKKFGVTEHVRMKSSLKFCVIASGDFDLYVAEARAFEWDIAAGHAVLNNAGGIVTDFEGNDIEYGKKDFKNPSIILKRTSDLQNG